MMLQFAPISQERRDEWIRRVKIAAIVYAGIVVLAGLIFFVAMLAGGAFDRAFLGLVAMVGGCALAAVVWATCHFAHTVIDALEAIKTLRERVDLLESTVELHGAQAGLSATLVDDLSALVAGKLEEARFPRIVSEDEQADSDASEPETIREEHEEREEVAAVQAEKPSLLRGEFSDLVRSRRYADALRKGEQIAAMFPKSRMAADFHDIREHLERRVVTQVVRAKIGS